MHKDYLVYDWTFNSVEGIVIAIYCSVSWTFFSTIVFILSQHIKHQLTDLVWKMNIRLLCM